MIKFYLISIFPEAFTSYLGESIIARALKKKLIGIKILNPRDFAKPEPSGRRPVDDRPYGGGPGMVLQAEPILKAVQKIKSASRRTKIFFLSPGGKQFDNELARKLARSKQDIVLISGRYEGIDARVKKILHAEEISIGPYVLTGGELPAMIIVDTIARQIPGVLSKFESVEENRVSSSEVYTRPEALKYKGKTHRVPKVLLSGHHEKINDWRKKKNSPLSKGDN